jgi:hypothetical protein
MTLEGEPEMTTRSEETWPPPERDDLELDLRIAIANARMEVYTAHRMTASAGAWHDILATLLDDRAFRRQLREAVEDAMHPCADELDPAEFVGKSETES